MCREVSRSKGEKVFAQFHTVAAFSCSFNSITGLMSRLRPFRGFIVLVLLFLVVALIADNSDATIYRSFNSFTSGFEIKTVKSFQFVWVELTQLKRDPTSFD